MDSVTTARLLRVVSHAGNQPVSQPPAPFSSLRPVVRVQAKPLVVDKWEEKRWVRKSGLLPGGIPAFEYAGFYQTAGGRKWRGLVVQSNDEVTPYILQPPLDAIARLTSHKWCFRERNGIHFVHLANAPRSVDEAIVNIEAFLNELEQAAGWPKLAESPVVRVTARAGRLE